MTRRKLLSFVGLGALLASTGAAWATISRSRNPYYQGPVSDHFNGLVFSDGRPVTKGLADVLRWQTGKREREAFLSPIRRRRRTSRPQASTASGSSISATLPSSIRLQA